MSMKPANFMRLFVTFLFVISAVLSRGQETSVSARDAITIQIMARSRVETDLKDLLNRVTSTELESNEVKEMIENSIRGGASRIFDSSNVVVEDDINPESHVSAGSREIDIRTYLNDLDLLYTKSANNAVVFTISGMSNLKKTNNLYLKVYFTSYFKNQHKKIDVPYTINNRVAEINVRKEGNRWATYIARIGFFNPADTVNDVLNDVTLQRDKSVGTALDSAAAARELLSYAERIKQEERARLLEEDRAQQVQFEQFIARGDNAMESNEYAEAIKNYQEAKKLRPYEQVVQVKIRSVIKAQANAARKRDDLFEEELNNARQAKRRRNYQEAITAYNQAKDLNPVEGAKYDTEVRKLTEIFRNIEELEEKYKAGLYDEAKKGYQSLIKKNKTCSDYYMGLGKCYEKLNDVSRALENYTKAVDVDTAQDNLQALILRADLYKKSGNYFKALPDYKTCVTQDKQNIRLYLEMADLKMKLGSANINEAIEFLNDGLKTYTGQKAPELYIQKGLLLIEKKDYKQGESVFTSAINLDTNNGFAFYNRGTCRLNLKRTAGAADDFNNARQKNLDSLYLRTIEEYAQSYFTQSQSSYASGQMDTALALVNIAIAINPAFDGYRYFKGEYYASQKKYLEAIDAYSQAEALNPRSYNTQYKKATAYFNLGEYSKALVPATAAVKLDPGNVFGEKLLGDCYYALKDYQNAASEYDRCVANILSSKFADNELTARVYNLLGRSAYYKGEYERSITALNSAVKKNATLTEAYFNRGASYLRLNQLSDAIDDMKKAVLADQSQEDWNYYLGTAYYAKKEFPLAVAYLSACIQQDSGHHFPDAVILRGQASFQQNNFKDALPDYQTAQRRGIDSVDQNFDTELGTIFLNTGNYDSSLACFGKAFKADSANGNISYGMATAYYLKGNIDQAMVWFEKSFQTKAKKKNEIKKDKLLANLQNDKRFKDLLSKYY